MYKSFGYDIYQIVNKYYSGGKKSEDAFGNHLLSNLYILDMRKSMPRDKDKITMKPTGKKIEPDQLEFH